MELDRVWIQAWAAALAIEAAAHLGTTAPDDVIEMSEMSTSAGRISSVAWCRTDLRRTEAPAGMPVPWTRSDEVLVVGEDDRCGAVA